ncbi:Retrotransposon gag protein [Quillaja saponaria]|uniref:Retrotransposon gag protein n=1 Tax=Quillaja saponaria TaxID=32244 RepID=A0AAD7LGR4_QUISA|nr:Retrotransposon gag protein [Quillaja saponaria]
MSRLPRVDLPKCNGSNFSDWMYRIEQFFKVDNTHDHVKFKLTIVNLKDKALQWYKAYMTSMVGIMVYWGKYVRNMAQRFGHGEEGDPLAILAKFK